MDPKQFTDNAPGQVVQVHKDEIAFWAFVPNPLPPKINFDPKLVMALSEATLALGELAGLGRTQPHPGILKGLARPYIHREAVFSSQIEGTRTQIRHLYAFEIGRGKLAGLEPYPPEEDIREVVNYVNAMRYGLDRLKEFPLAKRFIRELHARLLEGVRGGEIGRTPGEFRRSPNWIGAPGDTPSRATFVPPPADEMDTTLDEFEKYLNNENDPYSILVRLALIHYQFEAIHPFLDGNGRIGRLLISLLLIKWNLLPYPLLDLSEYLLNYRKEYYQHLLNVNTNGEWKEWILFFLKGVKIQSRSAILRASQLLDLHGKWRNKLLRTQQSTNALRALDLFFEQPIWTTTALQKALKVVPKTARDTLAKLEEVGFLKESSGKEYGKTYVAEEIFVIFERSFPPQEM